MSVCERDRVCVHMRFFLMRDGRDPPCRGPVRPPAVFSPLPRGSVPVAIEAQRKKTEKKKNCVSSGPGSLAPRTSLTVMGSGLRCVWLPGRHLEHIDKLFFRAGGHPPRFLRGVIFRGRSLVT